MGTVHNVLNTVLECCTVVFYTVCIVLFCIVLQYS
jgi:hypothetical protein